MSSFGKNRSAKTGRQAHCGECRRGRWAANAERINADRRAEYQKNPQPRLESAALWKRNNPERKREIDRARYIKNGAKRRAQAAAYYRDNPERIANYRKSSARRLVEKRSRAKHADKVRERDNAYHAKHRDALNAKVRQRYADDPTTATARIHRRRAAKLNAPGSGVSADEWRDILTAFGCCCAYCLKKLDAPEMDHVVPLARGGAHAADNVVPACSQCNSSKRDRSLLSLVSNPRLLVSRRMLTLNAA